MLSARVRAYRLATTFYLFGNVSMHIKTQTVTGHWFKLKYLIRKCYYICLLHRYEIRYTTIFNCEL